MRIGRKMGQFLDPGNVTPMRTGPITEPRGSLIRETFSFWINSIGQILQSPINTIFCNKNFQKTHSRRANDISDTWLRLSRKVIYDSERSHNKQNLYYNDLCDARNLRKQRNTSRFDDTGKKFDNPSPPMGLIFRRSSRSRRFFCYFWRMLRRWCIGLISLVRYLLNLRKICLIL